MRKSGGCWSRNSGSISLTKRILLIAFLSLLGVTAAAGWAWYHLKALERPAPLAQSQLFEVPPGLPFKSVAGRMQSADLVRSAFWLRVRVRLQGEARGIQAGEYEFDPGMSPLDMVRRMLEGKTKTWPIRFIEGWTFAQVRQSLNEDKHLDHVTPGLSDKQVMEALGHGGEQAEGRFFPDTYLVSKGESDLSVLRRAYQRMRKVLTEEWRGRRKGLPLKTPYQALILASIVEKETGEPSERPRIAGVFIRRLEKGMRLQTDPAVIYGLGARFDGNLTRKELEEDTPYNTYRHSGLPPTPIALPGKEAIHAVLHPAPGKALYFVARGDGTHVFSDTLAEHDRAVLKYQVRDRSKHYHSAPEEQSKP